MLGMHINHTAVRYQNPYSSTMGLCAASTFQTATDLAVVVLTEYRDNPGMPIASAFEYVATMVRKALLAGVPGENIIWVERHAEGGRQGARGHVVIGETYDYVVMPWDAGAYGKPVWRPVGVDRDTASFWRELFQTNKPLSGFPTFDQLMMSDVQLQTHDPEV